MTVRAVLEWLDSPAGDAAYGGLLLAALFVVVWSWKRG